VLWFCTAVFLIVFALTIAFESYRPAASGNAAVLGSSFVLRNVVLRQSASSLSAALGKLAPPAVVEITGVQRDREGRDWFQIKWHESTVYVPVNDLAPPKGKDAESGYTLLRISLTDLSDPAELEDTTKAVRLYRDRYPAEKRGEELLWLLAEKARELGLHTHDPRVLAGARERYEEVAREHGTHAPAASEALARFPEVPAARNRDATKPTDSGSGVLATRGSAAWGAYNDKTGPHKLMLLTETEVSVVLSATQLMKGEQILTGQVARAVVSNGETVVPAGSLCRVKVTGADDSAGKGSVELLLVEIQIGEQTYKVDAAPVHVRLGRALGRNSHLRFRLRRTLILAQ
jgi:hypothetical protein